MANPVGKIPVFPPVGDLALFGKFEDTADGQVELAAIFEAEVINAFGKNYATVCGNVQNFKNQTIECWPKRSEKITNSLMALQGCPGQVVIDAVVGEVG